MRTKFAGYALMLFPLVLHAARLDQNLDPAVLRPRDMSAF